jgi:hypothetical protein
VFTQAMALLLALALPKAGNNIPARIAMMAMTTSSSMRVKALMLPAWRAGFMGEVRTAYEVRREGRSSHFSAALRRAGRKAGNA